MTQIPNRKCMVYDELSIEPYCSNVATHIVALDYGEPGTTNVLSTFCCEKHLYFPGHHKAVPLDVWFVKHVRGDHERLTDWDLL